MAHHRVFFDAVYSRMWNWVRSPIRNPVFPQSPRLPLYKEKLRNLAKLQKIFWFSAIIDKNIKTMSKTCLYSDNGGSINQSFSYQKNFLNRLLTKSTKSLRDKVIFVGVNEESSLNPLKEKYLSKSDRLSLWDFRCLFYVASWKNSNHVVHEWWSCGTWRVIMWYMSGSLSAHE